MSDKSDIEALFQLPLDAFTAARNALAARLKKDKRASEAEEVRALTKPPATAWAVNQLFWQHPKEFRRLLAIGEKWRKRESSADLRAVLDERRAVVSQLGDLAMNILRDAGHAASLDATRRVTATLESLASRGAAGGDVEPGHLTADLEPPGFDDLAALLGGRKLGDAKVLPFTRVKPGATAGEKAKAEERAKAAREKAAAVVKEAEQALAESRQSDKRATVALQKAETQAAALQKQKLDLELRLKDAQESLHDAAQAARDSAKAVMAAERALDRARADLDGE